MAESSERSAMLANPQVAFVARQLLYIGGMLRPFPESDDPRTYAIIGAAIEVHRVLGTGFLELFYKDALEIELELRKIPFRREQRCNIEYKGHKLRDDYKMDFVCFNEVVVEVKARSVTGPADHAQVISYLASTRLQTGLLLNFGAARLEHRRFVWTSPELRNASGTTEPETSRPLRPGI